MKTASAISLGLREMPPSAKVNVSINRQDIIEAKDARLFEGPGKQGFCIDFTMPGYGLACAGELEPIYIRAKRFNPRKVTADRTNLHRVNAAFTALTEHQRMRALAVVGDDREMVIDLLADLMHYCDRFKVDFNSALDTAANHHNEEK